MKKYRFQCNKLIRDKLPNIIKKEKGAILSCKILNGKEYQIALKDKLLEESQEVRESTHKQELCEELADVLEVMLSLCRSYGLLWEEVEKIRQEKHQERGGFDEGVYCDYIEVTEENKRLSYYLARPHRYALICTTDPEEAHKGE